MFLKQSIRYFFYISLILFFTSIFSCFSSKAQNTISLQILPIDTVEKKLLNNLIKQLSSKNNFFSQYEAEKELQSFLFKLYDAGYLTASFDSIQLQLPTPNSELQTLNAFLHLGKIEQWAYLKKGNVDEEILSEAGFREKLYHNKPVYFKEIVKMQEKILNYCENHGYPFASIKLDSVQMQDNFLSAKLNLTKNKLVHIDSIVVKGEAKIAEVYLWNYLSVREGDLYNESIVSKISTRIRELPFLKETKPFVVVFTEKECKVLLFLEDRKASQMDGIIGLTNDKDKPGSILFTGEAHLKLQNPFGRGELIDINWKNPQAKTQDLKIRLLYPFVISKFGLDGNFALYKKDSTYLDVTKNIGIQYLLMGGNYLKIFLNNKTSTLLSTDNLKNLTVLPPYADMSSTIYGLGLKSERLDYRLNPRKGYSLEGTVGVGNKTIQKNPNINPELYNDLTLTTTQYHIEYGTDVYFSIKNRSAINIGFRGAHLLAPSILQNELFRIGGLKTLRGFDEESILSSSYNILKIEYRYLLEQNSYLFLFWNGAYYENKSMNFKGDSYDAPYGFGTGITFETKLGIFSVNYALGKQFSNPIDFRSGKISFGIVNYF